MILTDPAELALVDERSFRDGRGDDQLELPQVHVGADMDKVALAQSEKMFSALSRLCKDAKLATFWGEGHVVESPANARTLYDEAFAFLTLLIWPGQANP